MAAGAPPVTIEVFGKTGDVNTKLSQVKQNLGGISNSAASSSAKTSTSLMGIVKTAAILTTAFLAVRGAARLLGRAMGEAADAETIQTQFETILGSADAAKDRFAELAEFSKTTPFQLSGIAKASRTLETLTKGALSTGDGLRMVGDASAASGADLSNLSMHVGRLYDGLQSGRAVGESLMRMQELGLISGNTRNKIEDLQKAGMKGDAVWGVAANALNKFGGAMKRQSSTWGGLMSTLKDNIAAVFREFGTPILTELKPILSEAISLVSQLAPMAAKAAAVIGDGIKRMVQLTKAFIDLFQAGKLGKAAFLALKVGFMKAVNALANGLLLAVRLMIAQMIANFQTITDPAFWQGLFAIFQSLGAFFIGIATNFVAALMEGGKDFLLPIVAGIAFVGNKLIGAFRFAASALKAGLLGAAAAFLEKLEDAPLIGDGAKRGAKSARAGEANAKRQMEEAKKLMQQSFADTLKNSEKAYDETVSGLRDFGKAGMTVAGEKAEEGMDKMKGVAERHFKKLSDEARKHKTVSVLDETGAMNELKGLFADVLKTEKKEDEEKKDGKKRGGATTPAEAIRQSQVAVGDSLASLGGGGGIFGGGRSIAESQLAEQKKTNTKLDTLIEKQSGGLVVTP